MPYCQRTGSALHAVHCHSLKLDQICRPRTNSSGSDVQIAYFDSSRLFLTIYCMLRSAPVDGENYQQGRAHGAPTQRDVQTKGDGEPLLIYLYASELSSDSCSCRA